MLVSAVRKYTRAKKPDAPDAKHQHKESGCSFSFSNAVRTPDVANLLFVDTMHHALTVWCIFLDPVLMHWDNGDRKDKTSIQQKE